jgi:hypothetical protein
MNKIWTLGVKKSQNRPPAPKNGVEVKNQYGCVIYSSFGNFTWSKKRYCFGGKKTEFGAQNQYNRLIYPSIENFNSSKKIYTFRGKKAKISLQSPKMELRPQKIKNKFPLKR